MRKTAFILALALPLLLAAPAWAESYLSHYHSGGGGRYLSDYARGGYHAGSRGGYRHYGGPHGRIERKHSRDWNRYQRKLAEVEPGAGPSTSWIYNPMGIPLGWPQGSKEICGTYQRKPALCYGATTRYDPLIHGE